VISANAFEVALFFVIPDTVPFNEIVSDKSLFCTGSTSTVLTAVATWLVIFFTELPMIAATTTRTTSTIITTFFFPFFGFVLSPIFISPFS